MLRDGLYSIAEATEGRVVLRPDGFEGLEIDLARLWDEPEDLPQGISSP